MSFHRDTNRESRVELLSESLSCPSVEILTENLELNCYRSLYHVLP